MITLETTQKLKTVDKDGNEWTITLKKDESVNHKNNRWTLFFSFNEKEFALFRPQNNQAAQNTWELILKLKKNEKIENCIEKLEEKESKKERPKKRTLKK